MTTFSKGISIKRTVCLVCTRKTSVYHKLPGSTGLDISYHAVVITRIAVIDFQTDTLL